MMIIISKDLRVKFGEIRDQGTRPTCLAFATSDVHAASRSLPFVALSAEFLYFKAVHRSNPPDPNNGISVIAVSNALKLDGQPIEADWPYFPALPSNLAQWQPPTGLSVFRRTLSDKPKSIPVLIKAIDSGFPVLLCLRISEAFYTPDVEGVVAFRRDDPDTGYHAMAAVGHGLLGTAPVILIRNSWGANWGLDGHAWLHSRYVSARVHAVSTIP